MRIRTALPVLLSLFLPVLASALDVPALQGRVNDYANLIPPDARQRIEQKLAGLEQRTGAQVAVLTIPSLEGDSLEDFSLRVAEAWKLGQAKEDNGALLLVAQQDRKMRIEVGYGLEPVLTDLETSLIQRDYIVPAFRNGDYGGGIEAGVDAIVKAVEGEVPPAPEQPQPVGNPGGGGGGNFIAFALFFLITFSLNAVRSRSWMLYLFLLPFYFFVGSMVSFMVGLIAAGLWLVAFPILRLLFPQVPGSRRRGGGWFIGPGFGGGGGRSGGWGGGGGGFSGGGGSFGGGGSSSSW